jgi:PAS domain S-box-containing protein
VTARVLVLDDNAAARYVKTRVMQQAGFEVIEAGTGTEALRLAREMLPDIALLDVKLPDMSGLDVCRMVKGDPLTANMPVVQISATHVTEGDQAAGFEHGADIYLTEPVEAVVLLTVVRTLLRLRQTESGLLASEERFKAIVSQATAGIAQTDLEGRFEHVNQRYCEITGYSAAALSALTLQDITHPADLARHADLFREMVTDGRPFSIDKRYLRPNGDVVWASNAVSLVRDRTGVAQHAIAVVVDITERKAAEQRDQFLAQVSERLAELTDPPSTLQKITSVVVPQLADWCAIDLMDDDGQHKRVASSHVDSSTRELTHTLGAWSEDESGDLGIVTDVVNSRRAELIADIEQAATSQSSGDSRLEALREFGIKAYVCVPLMSRDKLLGALAMGITAPGRTYSEADLALASELGRRVSTAVENANLYNAIRESVARKDEFLATLAHELRNPLAPLANSLNIMRTAGGDARLVADARGVMERQVAQLRRLVDDLLDVSRFNTGKVELRKQRVSLTAVTNHAVEAARAGIEARHRFSMTLPAEDVDIEVDPARFAQVIVNLLDNESKYTPPGGEVTLAAAREGNSVVVRVSDTGIGISADMLDRIFEMFTQVENSLEKVQGGLGIGLTLVKRLAEMHGGTIDAYSAGLGKGSTFILRLPVVMEKGALESAAAAQQGALEQAAEKRKILVVDDNVDSARSLSMLLQLMGHEVDLSHDGADALAKVLASKPELVFLDIGLPSMNGYEVARRIRKSGDTRDVFLVALSGYGTSHDITRATEAGFDAHVVKPIDMENLNRLLTRVAQR